MVEKDSKTDFHSRQTATKDDDGDNPSVVLPETSSPWKVAELLEQKLSTDAHFRTSYESTTRDVIQILQLWGNVFSGQSHNMNSFLRGTSRLLHETEECIVALHYLKAWWCNARSQSTTLPEPFLAVDVCCGKGYFGMFLSYLVGYIWKDDDDNTIIPVASIVLLDKCRRDDNINWNHIDAANATAKAEHRPLLELWDATNLHHYDVLVDKLRKRNQPLAMTGIHCCKMLSPAFISLVNGLSDICHYSCLAPCCLPRNVIRGRCAIAVYQYETHTERQKRRQYVAYRTTPRLCCLCQSEYHRVRDCTRYAKNDPERSKKIQEATKTWPCWSCGVVGHFASQCAVREPPTLTPKAKVLVLDKNDKGSPFDRYCRLLATAFVSKTTRVIQTGLDNNKKKRQYSCTSRQLERRSQVRLYCRNRQQLGLGQKNMRQDSRNKHCVAAFVSGTMACFVGPDSYRRCDLTLDSRLGWHGWFDKINYRSSLGGGKVQSSCCGTMT